MSRIPVLITAPWLLAASCLLNAVAAAPQPSNRPEPGPQIAGLEREVFEPRLSAEEVARLLDALKNERERPAATRRLAAEGQGHVGRIIAFAAKCPDVEARQACADAVETLDAAYRTTVAGRRLGKLYREQTEGLLPTCWARFRKDPDDRRAVAFLMGADAEKVYAALGKGRDRYDGLRYLLLRVRELTPDRFAADHLYEYTYSGAVRVLGDVFPGVPARGGDVGFHRVVGQTLLKYVWVRKRSGQGSGVPAMGMLCYEGRRVFLFQVHGTQTAAHLSLTRHTYEPANVGRAEPTFRPDTTGPWYDSIEAVPLAPLPGVKLDPVRVGRANYAWARQFLPRVYRDMGQFQGGWQGDPPEVVPARIAVAEKPEPSAPQAPRPPQPAAPPVTPELRAAARKKAEAELAAAGAIEESKERRGLDLWQARLPRVEEAARLDPTWEEAARERIEALGMVVFYGLSKRQTDVEGCQRVLEAAEDYFRRFPAAAEHRGEIYGNLRIAVHVAFINLHMGRPQQLDPRRVLMLEAARRLTDHAFAHQQTRLGQDYSELMTNVVYRGMRLRGQPVAQREAWLDGNLTRCAHRVEAIKKKGDYDAIEGVVEDRQLLEIRAAALAAEDGRADRARALLNGLQARVTRGEKLYESAPERMREAWKALDDRQGLAGFERWLKDEAARQVFPLRITWPTVEVTVEEVLVSAMPDRTTSRIVTPTVRTTAVRYKATGGLTTWMQAVAEGDGRLYVTIGRGDRCTLGYLPLDALGRPVGATYYVRQPIGTELWDSLRALPPPPANLEVKDARYLGGKLYLAAGTSGLLIFDPKTDRWAHHAIGSLLPGKSLDTVYPFDGHTLFCIDRDFRNALCYAFELNEGRVASPQRLTDEWVDRVPVCLWRRGEELLGLSGVGPVEGLPTKKPRFTPFPTRRAFGWPCRPYREIRSMAELGTRRFFSDREGLHEFDAAGRIVRNWYGGALVRPGSDLDSWRNPEIPLLPDSPALAWGCPIVAANGMIYIVDRSSHDGVLGFDPAKDTWYGPLRVARSPEACMATRDALWLGSDDGLRYLDLAEFRRRARETGRVTTTGEFRQKRDAIIRSRPPLERAKLAFAMHKLDEAKGLVDSLLADDPDQPEALLLSAYLCEDWCLKRPQELIRFYRRLAEIKGNPPASLAGLMGWLHVLARRQQWQATCDLCGRILAEHPRMARYAERDVSYMRKYARQKLQEKTEKPKPGNTSAD